MRKKVGIIGHGTVGKAVERFFKDRFEAWVYDPKYPVAALAKDGDEYAKLASKEDMSRCDLAIVCVPTPMRDDGSCDTSLVEEVVGWCDAPLILIKSTVPPGTTNRLRALTGKRICFSPEYVGESRYFTPYWKGYADPSDMKKHDFHIVGGEGAGEVLEFFKAVGGPCPRYVATSETLAELAKYMENSYFATKVTFCNEWANIAAAFGQEYDELRELWLLDGRVERMHTAVFKDDRGFGGKCYPKDVNAIVAASVAEGYRPTLLTEVLSTNDRIRNGPRT